jgi:Na+/proline symporter
MGFVQFYFGLPRHGGHLSDLIPIYHKYKAYEYLEKRFDLKTRSLAAILFLFQRFGYRHYHLCPAIILSAILGWNLNYMTIAIGVLVIIYTFRGQKR